MEKAFKSFQKDADAISRRWRKLAFHLANSVPKQTCRNYAHLVEFSKSKAIYEYLANFDLIGRNLYAIGQIIIAVNGHI